MGDVKPWDMLNPKEPRSSEDVVQDRLTICATCEFFKPRTQQCSKCGCFMKMKTQLERAYCPLHKW